MRKLGVFNFISLDGCFKGPEGDISWHRQDAEGSGYAAEMLKAESTLLFGRVTYELMAGYWPTPEAILSQPTVAEGMNRAEKIVFSRTLNTVDWHNTRLVKSNIADEIRKMKQMEGNDMTLLGSGSIVTQFAEEGLIDEFRIMVDPVVLGGGTQIFKGISHRLDLRHTATRVFNNGNVLLSYRSEAKMQGSILA
jgi:dihydrofolate reductase